MTTKVGRPQQRAAEPIPKLQEKAPGGDGVTSETGHRFPEPGMRQKSAATALLCFIACCLVGLQSWTTLRLTGFDLGIFDQAVRAYSHFDPPRSAIKSIHHEFPPEFTLLGDHFTPLMAALAPLYWIWDDPRVLIIAQAGLFAIGVPVVRRIARQCCVDAPDPFRRRIVDFAGIIYALGWPLLNAANTGFHEVAFAVPIVLMMLDRGLAQRYAAAAAWGVVLCAVKEDLGLVVGAFGLLLAVRAHRRGNRKDRRNGVALAAVGPAISAVVIAWFLPAMGSPKGYYWSYARLGQDGGSALVNVLAAPWMLFEIAFTPSIKILMVLWILGTLAFLPLGSGTFLLAVPLLAERVLSDNPNHWVVINHYDAFLWPILVVASLESVGRMQRMKNRRRSLSVGIAGVCAVLSMAASAFLGISGLVDPSHWKPSPDKSALSEAVDLIPDGATAEVDNAVAPRLTSRADVMIVDETPRGAGWVLLREKDRTFPFEGVSQQKQRISLLLRNGYIEVWHQNGVVLLHRVEDLPIPGMRIPGPDSVPVREKVPSDVGRNIFQR
ncbi:DUF2079 domain-containing protein [Streptomyces sp. NPDC047141]|uniref:DUF2079 domain-containing protein n=1 Tax=Streptomyces sp. NPDC047141 TaxID=3155738 RepID=UPI00340114B5